MTDLQKVLNKSQKKIDRHTRVGQMIMRAEASKIEKLLRDSKIHKTENKNYERKKFNYTD